MTAALRSARGERPGEIVGTDRGELRVRTAEIGTDSGDLVDIVVPAE